MLSLDRPLPKPTDISRPYWDAAKNHYLAVQYCHHCKELIFYPRAVCPNDLRDDGLEWVRLSGKGKIYSYTVIRKAAHPAFMADTPYAYAIIELEEGLRMASNIVDCDPEALSIGMDVEVTFDDVNEEITLPKFKLAK